MRSVMSPRDLTGIKLPSPIYTPTVFTDVPSQSERVVQFHIVESCLL
jgi:hypothetical protein